LFIPGVTKDLLFRGFFPALEKQVLRRAFPVKRRLIRPPFLLPSQPMTLNPNATPRMTLSVTLFAALIFVSACGSIGSSREASGKPSGTSPQSDSRTILGKGAQPAKVSGRQFTVFDPGEKYVTKVISQREFGYVRIEHSEKGAAANDHPYNITVESLKQQLAELKTKRERDEKYETVFNDEELNEIAEPIAIALRAANSREDVTFAVSGQHSKRFLLSSRTVSTGRLFIKDGAINIIFNEIRGDFETEFFALGRLRPFLPGSRTEAAQAIVVPSENAVHRANNRRDWILLAHNTVTAPRTLQASPLTAPPAAAPIAPSPSTSVNETKPTMPLSSNEAERHDMEKRLTLLKRLKEKGLIGEKEYTEKQKEILKDL
jgi:hypothetical protein